MGFQVYEENALYRLRYTVSGTGVFNGTSTLGYAYYDYNVSGVIFRVASVLAGTDGNALKFEMLPPTSGASKTTARYDADRKTVSVQLRGTSSSITSTAAEVAAAVNGMNRTPLFIGVTTGGTIAASLSAVSLTSGLDADVSNGYGEVHTVGATNDTAGIIVLSQRRSWVLRTFAARLTANTTLSVSVVEINRARQVVSTGPAQVLYSAALTTPWIPTVAALNVVISPAQAIAVSAAGAQGTFCLTADMPTYATL